MTQVKFNLGKLDTSGVVDLANDPISITPTNRFTDADKKIIVNESIETNLDTHGTTTVITDPHEIANVMGTDGIEYMLQATEDLPVDVRFMLPSCVPATPLDESGAILDYRAIDSFYDHPRVQGLAEMMNFVGVINGDEQPVEKIVAAQAHHKKIDGHAPDLVGNDLNAYIAAGVYSDHECHDIDVECLGSVECRNDAVHRLRTLDPRVNQRDPEAVAVARQLLAKVCLGG